MTEASTTRPLVLGRGLRVIRVDLITKTGLIETFDFSAAAVTVLSGPRNSSKTTTLKVIAYCLGGRESVAEDLGAPIEEKYAALRVTVAIDGEQHELTRDLTTPGRRGKVVVDATTELTPSDASLWLMGQLAWPTLQIPLGRNASTATQLTPLTFRSVFRHIYRREDSWTEFAYKEQEFLRRAVISLFLGFAPQRYENAEFELGRAQRELAAAQAVYRDVLTSTDDAVSSIVQQLGLPSVLDASTLDSAEAELVERLLGARAERDAIVRAAGEAAEMATAAGVDADVPERLQMASTLAAEAAARVSSLELVVREHSRSQGQVQSELNRLSRLVDAVQVFDQLPVRVCPSCEQAVDPARDRDAGTCYVCLQSVTEDLRQRRAERERRALENELTELAEALERAELELLEARAIEREAAETRVELANQLQDERVAVLAPFMARLEDAATLIGRLEQQVAAIPAVRRILARRTDAEDAQAWAAAEVERLQRLANADAELASEAAERCAAFADKMNEFLRGSPTRSWVEGLVTISADELTFFVGTRPWDQMLGAEARVVFFLAYCYALLHLDTLLGAAAKAPGVLLLDNPYQQGVPEPVVLEAVNRVAAAADELGVQVVIAQARDATGLTAPHQLVQMPTEYA